MSGYGDRNQYDQRGQYGGYGRNQAPYGQDEYGEGSNIEMQNVQQPSNPNEILNDCRDVERAIQNLESRLLEQIKVLQQQLLQDADTSSNNAAHQQLDALSSELMQQYRSLTTRVRRIKGKRDANSPKNQPHVDRIDRRIRTAMNEYQKLESSFRKRTEDQMARQYRIVRPEASEAEVREAVQDSTGTIFSEALMQSDRRGQSRSVLREMESRNRELAKIEQQMVELAQLFQDLDVMIVQQDTVVTQIEQKAEEVVENLDKGNQEIATAVTTAKATRKKKWICFGICILIILIVVIVVVIYFTVINPPNHNKKRDLVIDGIDGTATGFGLETRQISRIMRYVDNAARGLPPSDGA